MMNDFTEAAQARIIAALKAKNAIRECPRCNNPQFSLAHGFGAAEMHRTTNPELEFGQATAGRIPTVILICTNCGFFAEHALGALGLKDL